MTRKEADVCCEKFTTMIGGLALIEGIMMRGPKKDAIVIRGKEGLTLEVSDRKVFPKGSYKTWPFFRGIFNFFDALCIKANRHISSNGSNNNRNLICVGRNLADSSAMSGKNTVNDFNHIADAERICLYKFLSADRTGFLVRKGNRS